MTPGRKRICFVTASPLTVKVFLSDQIAALAREHDVTVIANFESGEQLDALRGAARLLSVPIDRDVAPLSDLRCLWRLLRVFRREGFDIAHTVTPKAGLLAQMAAYVLRVPVRIHVFTGQAWVTRGGPWRWALKAIDRLIAGLATHVLVDSPSQRDFLIGQGVLSAPKSRILLSGSISGVDTERFRPDREARARIRDTLGIGGNTVVFLFVGRLNADKGLFDLASAFADSGLRGAVLLVVGPDEERIRPRMHELGGGARLIFLDYTPVPQDYMAAADVFCLPSYREGFGTAIIEAAAAGIPAIASDIYGVRDAVADGETGLLHPARDVAAIRGCMLRLAQDEALRLRLGRAAREHAVRRFAMPAITAALIEYYRGLPI